MIEEKKFNSNEWVYRVQELNDVQGNPIRCYTAPEFLDFVNETRLEFFRQHPEYDEKEWGREFYDFEYERQVVLDAKKNFSAAFESTLIVVVELENNSTLCEELQDMIHCYQAKDFIPRLELRELTEIARDYDDCADEYLN